MKLARTMFLALSLFLSPGCIHTTTVVRQYPKYMIGGQQLVKINTETGESWVFVSGFWVPIKEMEMYIARPQAGPQIGP